MIVLGSVSSAIAPLLLVAKRSRTMVIYTLAGAFFNALACFMVSNTKSYEDSLTNKALFILLLNLTLAGGATKLPKNALPTRTIFKIWVIQNIFSLISLGVLHYQRLQRLAKEKEELEAWVNAKPEEKVTRELVKEAILLAVNTKGFPVLSYSSLPKCADKKFPRITDLPPEIGRLSHCINLVLLGHQLTTIPEEIANLTLKNLDISGNAFESLPPILCKLQSLEELVANSNKIDILPEPIGDLKKLRVLFLGNNQLEKLPEAIGDCHSLTHLYFWMNNLKTVPKNIGNLQHLKFLNLDDNPIESLPEEIRNLPKTCEIKVFGRTYTPNTVSLTPPDTH